MDPRLLDYYNRELAFVRESGTEFAALYPRIAAGLGLDAAGRTDPHVERLLEGFAFLTARIQLKLDARHPDFTQHLLEMIYPLVLAPVPSCAIVELQPNYREDALHAGFTVPVGTALRSVVAKGGTLSCEFRTAHPVTLWPIQIAAVHYLVGAGAVAAAGVRAGPEVRSAVRLRLKSQGVPFSLLKASELTFYLNAAPDIAANLYELVLGAGAGAWVADARNPGAGALLPAGSIQPVGFEDEQALLPLARRGFNGYRLLQEYFTCPERFRFFSVTGLMDSLARVNSDELELVILLNRTDAGLDGALDVQHFRLNCTPVVNLFPRVLDRIHVASGDTELHVVPDRNRPQDFEVFTIDSVRGIGSNSDQTFELQPFYATGFRNAQDQERAFYTLQRRQRLYSARQALTRQRTEYIGTECFMSVVDDRNRQFSGELRQIDVHALCTNRDLPLQMPVGKGPTDFILDGAAPVDAVRCLSGPTPPRPSPAFGDTAWKLISHLSMNYLSLCESGAGGGPDLLRELLALYARPDDPVAARQVEGVRSVRVEPIVERLPIGGPISFGRGLRITLELDDAAFEGTGIMVLGSVLERVLGRSVSINSFTQLTLRSSNRGEIKRWPVRAGMRATA